jgi:predicted DNA-binding protein with PD1-like motif
MMKSLFTTLALLSIMASLSGQTIEDEPFYHIKAPDSLVGNEEVPDVYYSYTSFEKVMVARLKHQTDILEGLNEIVQKEKIKNAVILTGIGSVTNWHIHVVDNKTFPSENVFIKKDIPADVTNITGYVVDGRVHAHLTLSDESLAIGGHLEPGTNVFTFCVITIAVLDDNTSLTRFDDKTLR